jgi:hypothetical protein
MGDGITGLILYRTEYLVLVSRLVEKICDSLNKTRETLLFLTEL